MSQNDYVIANQTTPLFRADLNLALQALASNSSGSSAPSTTYANMMWYDTTNNILKMRSEADDAWITLGTLDQSLNTFTPAGLTNLTNLSQAQVEDDTSTVFGQVSGQRLAQAVVAHVANNNVLGIGGYVFATARTTVGPGTLVAGAALKLTSAAYAAEVGGGVLTSLTLASNVLPGTYVCCGYETIVNNPGQMSLYGATLYKRIL
jgi:hypothetical protein